MLDADENHRTHPIVSILQQGVSRRTALLFFFSYGLLSMHTNADATARIPALGYGVKYEIPLAGSPLALSWSPDGRFLALAQKTPQGTQVTLLDVPRHKISFSRTFHDNPSLGFADPTRLLVASPKGILYSYLVPSGRLEWNISMPPNAVMAASGGGRIALVTRQGIEILDARNGMVTERLAGSMAVTRKGAVVWVGTNTLMALERQSRKIFFWSRNRRLPRTWQVPDCPRLPIQAAFSSSGRHLALICPGANRRHALISLHGVLPGGTPIQAFVRKVGILQAKGFANISVTDGKVAMALGLLYGGALVRSGGDFVPIPVSSRSRTIATLSPRGRRLALANGRFLTLLQRSGGTRLNPVPRHSASRIIGPGPSRHVVAFLGGQRYIHAHPDKAYALTMTRNALVSSGSDGTLAMFDRWSGALIARVGKPGPLHAEWVEADPRGNKLVVAWGDGHISIHEARTGRVLLTWAAHPNAVFEAHFSRDGRRILSCGEDGIPRIWDASTGTNIALVPSLQSNRKTLGWSSSASNASNTCAFHPTNSWVAMGTPNGQVGWVNWRTSRTVAIRRMPGGAGVMSLLSWKAGDRILATTTSALCRWDGRTNQAPLCLSTRGTNIGMTWVKPYRILAVGTANPTPNALLIDVTDMKVLRRWTATVGRNRQKVDLGKGKAIFDLEYDPQLGILHGTLQTGWIVTWRLTP